MKKSLMGDDMNLTNRQNLPIGLRKKAKGWDYYPGLGGWGHFQAVNVLIRTSWANIKRSLSC